MSPALPGGVLHLEPLGAGRVAAGPGGLRHCRRHTPPADLAIPADTRILSCPRWVHPDHGACAAWWRRGGTIALTRGALLAATIQPATGPSPAQALVRRQQHRRSRDPAWLGALAARLVNAKILAQRQVLGQHLQRRPDDAVVARTCRDLDALRTALPGQRDLAAVRGLEGQAARCYFGAWPALGGLDTFARQARSGADHLNLLLDVGYARLCLLVTQELLATGADLALGALHADDGTRPTLALDLMEPLRPVVVDRFVLHLWRESDLRAWFVIGSSERIWDFTPTGRRCWRERWTTWIHGSARRPGQIQRIAGTVRTWTAAILGAAAPPQRWPQLHDAGGRW